jgi:epoxyqueuosine reductase
LAGPFKLKPLLCLAFNAWKTHPATGSGISAYIPAAVREKMAAHIHGCDLCQAACPRNRRKIEDRFPEDPFLKLLDDDFSLSRVLAMPKLFFEKRIRPIMYNYLQEPKYFQRNAAVALGNQGDPDSGPELVRALSSPHDIVRGHAAWALGKIGGKKSDAALEAALSGETDEEVKKEMRSAREALTA